MLFRSLFNPYRAKDDIIVTAGRLWDEGKNVALLVQDEMPFPVCMVGSNEHPASQTQAAVSEEARSGVHFNSPRDEQQLTRLLSRAAIYAATSRYEPFGLAPVEAAFSRCAIVASDIPSFRELWEGAAIFFENNNPQSLRRTLESLAEDREFRQLYGNLAYNRARLKFLSDRMVEAYMSLYRSLVPAQILTA